MDLILLFEDQLDPELCLCAVRNERLQDWEIMNDRPSEELLKRLLKLHMMGTEIIRTGFRGRL